MSYTCPMPNPEIQGELVDDGRGRYLGECVSLVKRLCPLLPPTVQWKKGRLAKEEVQLPAGTVIATFNKSEKYQGHAAIFISQDATGLDVWDQYNHPPKPVGKRRLRFDDHRTDVNNGNKFFVVE